MSIATNSPDEGAISRIDLRSLRRSSAMVRSPTSARSMLPSGAHLHDGIFDGDCEGVSVIHYWTGRRWVILPGDPSRL